MPRKPIGMVLFVGALFLAAVVMSAARPALRSLFMKTPTIGWAVADASEDWDTADRGSGGRLVLRTADGGRTWRDVSPPGLADLDRRTFTSAFFLNARAGWVLTGRSGQPISRLLSTADAGTHWIRTRLRLPPDEQAEVTFADARHGGILTNRQSTREGGAGEMRLYQTDDAGRIWRLSFRRAGLIAASPTGLTFRTAADLWITTFQEHRRDPLPLYHSRDGGRTWSSVLFPVPAPPPGEDVAAEWDGDNAFAYPPTFSGADKRDGVLAISFESFVGDLAAPLAIYGTHDGGGHWSLQSRVPLTLWAGQPLDFLDARHGWALKNEVTGGSPPPDFPALRVTVDAGRTWRTIRLAGEWPLDGTQF